MSTKVTVPREKLLKAMKDKAKANQKAYDDAIAAQSPAAGLVKAVNDEIDRVFGKGAALSKYEPRNIYTKSGVQTYATNLYNGLGIVISPPLAPPQLYEKQITILEMSTDKELSIDDSSDYFGFLNS